MLPAKYCESDKINFVWCKCFYSNCHTLAIPSESPSGDSDEAKKTETLLRQSLPSGDLTIAIPSESPSGDSDEAKKTDEAEKTYNFQLYKLSTHFFSLTKVTTSSPSLTPDKTSTIPSSPRNPI